MVEQPTRADILFESITMPPWTEYVTMHDLEVLYWAATTKSLAGKSDKRRSAIKQVMEARGFKLMAGGTNRLVFKHYEDPHIVGKVALDDVGLKDNTAEYIVQRSIFPNVAKMIQVCPSGVLGFAERVTPILTREEYNAYLPMIYMMLMDVLGEYVMDDVGTDYFKNLGIRQGYGVVLLDYPYLYKLDGNKLCCNDINPATGIRCGGEIDYDAGLNHLYCTKCGIQYLAADLEDNLAKHKITIRHQKGGKRPMKVVIMKGGKVIAGNDYYSSDVMEEIKKQEQPKQYEGIHASIVKGNKVIAGTGSDPNEIANVVQELVLPDPVIEETKEEEPKEMVREDINEEKHEDLNSIPTNIVVDTPAIAPTMFVSPPVDTTPVIEEPKKKVQEEIKHDEDDFPPVQWGAPKVQEDSPSRMKPYYVSPREVDESDVIVDDTPRSRNAYKTGGFLGGN